MTDRETELVVAGRHRDPHRILGLHDGVVRAYRPDAARMRVLLGPDLDTPVEMKMIHPAGLFEGRIDTDDDSVMYELEAVYLRGNEETTYRFCDPYRAWPTLGDMDLHLFGEGRHYRLWEVLGSHCRVHEGMAGVSFAVWAPNARAVRVVGDWNFWDGRVQNGGSYF